MANTESSAVIRFINQVQSQPLFEAEIAQPVAEHRRDSATVVVGQPEPRGWLPWAVAGAALLGVAVAVGAIVALTGDVPVAPAQPAAVAGAAPPSAPAAAAAADETEDDEPGAAENAPIAPAEAGGDGEAEPLALAPAADDTVAEAIATDDGSEADPAVPADDSDLAETAVEPTAEAAEKETAALLAGGAVPADHGDDGDDGDDGTSAAEASAIAEEDVYTAGFDIRVVPTGAVVVLDGNELGAAPLRVGRLAPGAHTIELRPPAGYAPKTLEVELQPRARADLQIALEASPVAARFDTEPRGATVTLIADGEPRILGTSPASAELDPSRSYQVVFSMEGYEVETRAVTIAPATDVEVLAVMREPGAKPAVAARKPARAAKPKAAEPPKAAKRAAKRSEPRAKSAPKRELRSRAPAAPKREIASDGKGVLMIGAKPPCQIFIDGKRTGLTTPQRSIKLSPGKHTITLVNREFKIKRTFTVAIGAGKTTRLIKDMSKRL